MKRILFVDDEPQVLAGLRDLLRKQRSQWDMVFALGGQAALDELANGAFDVVVSDMRMPGIDGAALLSKVKEQYPASARIILSGHAERDSVVRALPVAHQFLSKPCDATLLRVVIERACELQRLLQDERIRSVIGKLDRLPSVPQTYWELTQAAGHVGVAIEDLADIVEQDPAMAVKVLQLVNSSYFGLPKRLTSIRQAVSYLGIDLLKALALSVHAFGTMGVTPIEGFSLEQLQKHSLLTARLVKRMVPDVKRAGEAFTAALVHDIGKIVFAISMPETFARVVLGVRQTGRPFHVLEQELLGVTHAEVGAYLLGFWGLPLSIVETVAYHHSPSFVADGEVDILAAVHVADALLNAYMNKSRTPPSEDLLDPLFIERAGLGGRLDEWRGLAETVASAANQGASG
jgi:putative nucleotidyltransferase with HDIG domain